MGFLTGRRITVTGGAGFLGREVCRALQPFGPAPIFVPRSREYDLRRRDDILRMLRVAKPEVIVHLAALGGGIAAQRANPGRYFYDNAIMGVELLEAARLYGVEKFVVVGSLGDDAAHASAKKMLVIQAQAYREQYGMNAIALLPANLYGPGDNFDRAESHVIPSLVRKAIEARDEGRGYIEAWGTGVVTREFLFIRDAACAIATATERYSKPQPVSIGSGMEITIRDLATTICRLCDFRGEIRWDCSRPEGGSHRGSETCHAQQEFGFQATTDLTTGLRETIGWYESHGRSAVSPTVPFSSHVREAA